MRWEHYGTDGLPYYYRGDDEIMELLKELFPDHEFKIIRTREGDRVVVDIENENDIEAKELYEMSDLNCDVNPYTGELFLEDRTVVGVIDSDGDLRWESQIIDSLSQIELNSLDDKIASFIDDHWDFYCDAHVRDYLLAFCRDQGFDPEETEED